MASPHSASPLAMTSGNRFGPTGWPGTGGSSQPPYAAAPPRPTRNNPVTRSERRMRRASGLGQAGGLHRVAHLGIALVHELGEFGGVAPNRSKTAVAHEILELLRVVDFLQRRGEFCCDL